MMLDGFRPLFPFVETAAENIFKSAAKNVLAVTALLVLLCPSLRTAASPIPASEKIVDEFMNRYELLEAFNDRNEREGRPERNEYIIDLSADWIDVRPGINLSSGSQKALTEMLRDFNGKRKDNLRFYVVVTGVLQYRLTSEARIEQLPKYLFRRDHNLHAGLNTLLGTDDRSNLEHFYRRELDNIRTEILEAMKAKKYTERVLYTYTGVAFYDADDKEKWYSVDHLEITGALTQIQDKIRSTARQQWILPDATQPSFKGQTYNDRIRLSVANIITAIGIEYDGGGASTTGITDCGKDPADIAHETFEHSTAYEDAVTGMAKLLDAPAREQQISPYMMVDKPDNFKNPRLRDMILPDVVFNTEILSDKLNLLNDTQKSRSDYKMYVVFKEVPFVIPDNERAAFAEKVKNRSAGVAKQPNTIIVVVPYYVCTSKELYVGVDDRERTGLDKDTEYVYPMLLMPAAHGPNESMNLVMNSALVREKSFHSGFNDAFKHIPKDHTAYLGYLLWNGQQMFTEYPEKRVTGFSNFADIHLFVDDRIEKIIPYVSNCEYEYNNSIANSVVLGVNGFYTSYNEEYEKYLSCLAVSQNEIRKIFNSNPAPLFKELNAGKCTIRQRILAGEDGMLAAMYYMQASYHSKITKYWTEKGAGALEEVTLENDIFYGNKNPYPRKLWVLTAIDASSLVASFIGLDFVFDAAGGIICIAVGNDKEAAVYGASIFVPASIIRGWQYVKGLKNIGSLSRQSYELVTKSKGTIVHASAGLSVAELGGKMNLVPGDADPLDLLRALGVVNEEVLAAAKANPSVRQGLEESMTVRQGDVITPKTGLQGDYTMDEIQRRANDKEVIKRYKEELSDDPSLDFVTFLRNTEPKAVFDKTDQVVLDVVKNIRYDPHYFYVFIHGHSSYDFSVCMADKSCVFVSHIQLADFLIGQKNFVNAITKEGKNIKLVSCGAAANDAARKLSARLHELSGMEGSPIKGASPVIEAPDVEYGIYIYKDDNGNIKYLEEGSPQPNGKWYAYKAGQPLGPIKENPDIPQFSIDIRRAQIKEMPAYKNVPFDITEFLCNANVMDCEEAIVKDGIDKLFPGHSIHELAAIRYYARDNTINEKLRQGIAEDFYEGMNYLLKNGLGKGIPYKNDVYAGLDPIKSSIANNWKESDVVSFRDYTSSSPHEVAGERFMNLNNGNVLLIIKEPDAMEITRISPERVEEIVIQSKQKFIVTKIETENYSGKTWKRITLIKKQD